MVAMPSWIWSIAEPSGQSLTNLADVVQMQEDSWSIETNPSLHVAWNKLRFILSKIGIFIVERQRRF